jgi:adenylate cyclase
MPTSPFQFLVLQESGIRSIAEMAGKRVGVGPRGGTSAAREILARVEALNATEMAAGNPALSLNIALHTGEVTYGNIGTADRLDFTVVGPAVNEAARLEGLCKELGRPILISKSFVQAAQGVREQFLSVGWHPLRGVREAREVFTI